MSAFEQGVAAICPACDQERSQERVFEGRGGATPVLCVLRGHPYLTLRRRAQYGARVGTGDSAAGSGVARGAARRRRRAPYRADESFRAGDLIGHPKFELGYVVTVLSPGNEMQVLFGDKRRILVCKLDLLARAQEAAAKHPDPAKPPRQPPARRRSRPRPRSEPAPVSHDAPKQKQGPVACPRCGRSAHPYNVLQTPSGEPAGCMYRRG